MAKDWLERWVAEDGERVRQLLVKVVASSGLTRKGLDERLGRGAGYTSGVLTGRLELKQEHVSAILLAVGIHPGVFFEILYPKDVPIGPDDAMSDFARRLALLGISTEPRPAPPPAAPMTFAEIMALVEDGVQRALAATERQREPAARKKPPAKQKR